MIADAAKKSTKAVSFYASALRRDGAAISDPATSTDTAKHFNV